MKKYKLPGADGNFYESETPCEYGGNSKLRIYGKLGYGSALSSVRRFPGQYEKHRVFRGNCLRRKYKEYTADHESYRRKFGLQKS